MVKSFPDLSKLAKLSDFHRLKNKLKKIGQNRLVDRDTEFEA